MEEHTKLCPSCQQEKDFSCFSLNKKKSNQLQHYCKECSRLKLKEWKLANPQVYKESDRKTKEKRREANKQLKREWIKNNPDKVKEYREKYYDTHQKSTKKWRANNKEHVAKTKKAWNEKNKEKLKDQAKIWKENNRAKILGYQVRRRARKLNAISPTHNLERENELYRLSEELSKNSNINYNVDHIFPLSKGGPHHHDNLQVIPAILNSEKRDSLTFRHKDIIHWTDLPPHVLELIDPEKLRKAYGELLCILPHAKQFLGS